MRGRWPDGLEFIDKLQGSAQTKERLKGILSTLLGLTRAQDVYTGLGMSETRFHQLRETSLQHALTAIEPRPAGRPSRVAAAPAEQIRMLQQRVRELEQALLEAEVREEIALILPHARCTEQAGATATLEKKMPPPRVKIRKSR
jgi:hypothetical protein